MAGEGSQAGSKALFEGARAPRRKQLPLAVSASHPGLTAARNMTPLQTSVLGKKGLDSTHTLRKAFVSALSLALPRSPRHTKKKRKPFVYAHSLIQPQIEIYVSHIHSLCQLHKNIICIITCLISPYFLFVKLFH